MAQNHIKLFTSKKSKWFSRGCSPWSVRREAECGTTGSQTPLLSYRPNNVQRAIDVQSLSACISLVPFVFLFSHFSSNLLLPLPADGRNWWNNAHFFPIFISIRWGGILNPGSRKKEKGGWGDSEKAMREFLRKSRKWVKGEEIAAVEKVCATSLSRTKDKQVINAARRHEEKLCLRTFPGFCSAHRNNTVQWPSQSGQTHTHIWASAQPLMKETKSRAQNDDAWASLRFGLLQTTYKITINIYQQLI